jgi:hypothetical protein
MPMFQGRLQTTDPFNSGSIARLSTRNNGGEHGPK